MRITCLLLATAIFSVGPAVAQQPMTGLFRAEATCAAPPSVRAPDENPGNVRVVAGQAYELLGRNATPGSHYLIRIPGAEPERRWVAYGCGRIGDDAQQAVGPDYFVLAANWPAAFCEEVPRARECTTARPDSRFTLHGLWPQTPDQQTYCHASRRAAAREESARWRDLPAIAVRGETEGRLARVMPGVQSGLERHQWAKHGTCSGMAADAYFSEAVRLMDALNASPVRDLFAGHVGKDLSARAIRTAFDTSFGPGSGRKVLVDCVRLDGRQLIRELRIALAAPVAGQALATLIAGGPAQPPGCGGGEVDAPG